MTDFGIGWCFLESKVVRNTLECEKGERMLTVVCSWKDVFDYSVHVRLFRQHVPGDDRHRFPLKSEQFSDDTLRMN